MPTTLTKIKKYVAQTPRYSRKPSGLVHFQRTIYWAKRLNPRADEPILIAAFAHDIERGFNLQKLEDKYKNTEINNRQILLSHQQQGARLIKEFLKKEKYPPQQINRIASMIARHEVGGDRESNLIKDADSLSYLENNIKHHIILAPKLGKEKIKRKLDWMYQRISSPKAKKIAKPYYQKALKQLEKY